MLSGKSITLLWLFFGQINALKECDPDVDVDWGYQQSNGPCKWCTDLGFKRCCETVPYQSPINIITHSAKPYPHGIVFKNYDREPHKMKLQNNGYYAELTIEVDDQNTLRNMPYISGEKLGGNNYIFEQLHFHWGCTSAQGAEHQLDGNEHIPMEMHIVHFNRDRYGNFTTAACQEDFSVAVIAVFFKISPGDNNKFSRITNALNNIQKADSTPAHVAPFKLQDLLPGDKTNTYFYNGSLTTPPCYGSVRWILFDTPVDISEEQMKKFRSLYTADGSPLVNNFRPIQNSNNRNIYKYHKEKQWLHLW